LICAGRDPTDSLDFVMRRLSSWLTAVAVVFPLLSAGAPTARAAPGDPVYVSVGDSLSVGYQPGRGRTDHGYVDDLLRRVRRTIPTLAVRKFGCPGETTRAMITGVDSGCSYAAGSQLDAAVAYLNNHSGDMAFITIDVGVNDMVNRCMDFHTGMLNRGCVVEMRPRLRHRLMHIIDALRAAAGPGVPILGMTYHDPFLGFWGLVPHGRELARTAARGWMPFNRGLTNAYEDSGAVVANVARTFRVNDFWDKVVVPGRGPLPLNVAHACLWTWFCTPRFFGDPHPNPTGYEKIAGTFNRKLQPLLP
jgi:lysophospholipase L1-like esterase